ncbi:hypothetical protein GT370_07295 [Acidocella sp. MX-AZ03]|uniref:hypothetical protein n=1 Tax=Acidocella sp. MX-AZ03 TaxID=2697363 RepID=UPI0022DE756B|nr:hypothetical protein [Acidocella sp. MX-AZ03]WBO60568.1 hypothetical protein GT370_07295 [Acidocella sp. MX-AZ03]
MTICATAFPMLRELLHAGAEVREIAVALQAKLGAVRRAITGNGLVRGQMDLFADWRPAMSRPLARAPSTRPPRGYIRNSGRRCSLDTWRLPTPPRCRNPPRRSLT